MKRYYLLIIVLLPFVGVAQSNCARTQSLTREEILQMPEFKNTTSIVAVSFDFKVINTPSELKDEGGSYRILTDEYKEFQKLTPEQEYQVLDILVNYQFRPRQHGYSVGECYQPRNALLFYDWLGGVIGYIEFCFTCNGQRFDPKKESLSPFCDGKNEMIRDWMKSIGITYGVNGEID